MSTLHIGARKVADGAADWDGWLDDLAVFDVELSPRQIKALADGTDAGKVVAAPTVLERMPDPAWHTLVARPLSSLMAQYPAQESLKQGPFIGQVSDTGATIWARMPEPGRYAATATTPDGRFHTARRAPTSASRTGGAHTISI